MKDITQYIAILFMSVLFGVAIGALIIAFSGIELEHKDSYRLIYVICALLLAPFITIQSRKQY